MQNAKCRMQNEGSLRSEFYPCKYWHLLLQLRRQNTNDYNQLFQNCGLVFFCGRHLRFIKTVRRDRNSAFCTLHSALNNQPFVVTKPSLFCAVILPRKNKFYVFLSKNLTSDKFHKNYCFFIRCVLLYTYL